MTFVDPLVGPSGDGASWDTRRTFDAFQKQIRQFMPAGLLAPYAGSTAPTGWLLCAGQTVSRRDYKQLFDAIGTTYGAGDGSTTFALPDLRGRTPVALDNMGGTDAGRLSVANTLGGSGGEELHTLTTAEMPSHAHAQVVAANAGTSAIRADFVADGNFSVYPQGTNTGSTGGGGAHNNLQPYMLLNYIIKT